MRYSVTTLAYLFRKMLDNALYSFSPTKKVTVTSLRSLLSHVPFASDEPSGWIPLYTMVTFRPDINYATVKKKAERQDRVLKTVSWIGTAILGITGLGIARVAFHRFRR